MNEQEKILRQERGALVEDMRRLVEGDSEQWTPEKRIKFDMIDTKVKNLASRIEAVKRTSELEEELERPLTPNPPADEMGNRPRAETWRDESGKEIRVYQPNEKIASRSDFDGLTFGGFVRAMVLGARTPAEKRALGEGTDSAGGYTVPLALSRQVIDLMRAKSHVVRAGAVTVPLETEKTSIARIATDPVPAWRSENAVIAESDPTFGAVQFVARSLAVLVKVSRELLEDSVNIEQALSMAFAGSLGGELDRVAILGSGTPPEPQGVKNTSGISSVEMATDGAQFTDWTKYLALLQDMAENNATPATAAIMAPRTYFTIQGLTDTTDQPLRAPAVIEAIPMLVSSKIPIDETQGTSNNASSIFCGDFRQLMIGVRSGLRIEVLRELYAGNHQYAFVAHLRADIALAQPAAFGKLIGIIP